MEHSHKVTRSKIFDEIKSKYGQAAANSSEHVGKASWWDSATNYSLRLRKQEVKPEGPVGGLS